MSCSLHLAFHSGGAAPESTCTVTGGQGLRGNIAVSTAVPSGTLGRINSLGTTLCQHGFTVFGLRFILKHCTTLYHEVTSVKAVPSEDLCIMLY